MANGFSPVRMARASKEAALSLPLPSPSISSPRLNGGMLSKCSFVSCCHVFRFGGLRIATNCWPPLRSVGNVDALGNWDTSQAVTLSASEYTESNPVWTGSVSLTSGAVVEYKFIEVDSSGSVTWEADPNRTLSVAGCETAMVVSSTWKS